MRGVGSLLTAAVTAASPAFASVPATTERVPVTPLAAVRALALPRLVTNPIARPATDDVRASVTGVSVVAEEAAAAAVLIRVDRSVEVQDFVLDGPRRVVLDISGATLAVAGGSRYDGTARGGVRNVRLAQFRAGIVRVVVELDGPRTYRIERTDGAVRLVVQGASGAAFAPWQAGRAVDATRPAVAAAEPVEASTEHAAEQPVEQPPRAARREAARPAPQPAAPRESREVRDAQETRESRETPAAESPAPRQVATRESAARESASRDGARLTVTYQDADIRDVVAAFAAFSGRTIIVGKEVTGNITAEIKDQPWDVALRALLRSQGLALSEDAANGIITVDSYKNLASNRATEPIATRIIDINYAKADSLVPLVQTLLSRECAPGDLTAAQAAAAAQNPGQAGSTAQQTGPQGVPRGCVVRGAVTADRSTNKLLISDVPTNLPEIMARVRELDVRTPQVAIKAKILFVNRTGLEDIGVSYDLGTGTQQFFQQLVQRIDPSTRKPIDTNGDGVPDGLGGGTPFPGDRIALGGNALSALANANAALQPSALNLIYSATIGRFQLTSFVNALQQSELADVQSEPSIVTLNNRPAEIFVGQQVPIRVIDASSGAAFGNAPRATVRLEEAGIRLNVIPQVTNNRRIVLDVSAENSDAQLSSTDVGVVFNRQRAQNRVLVGDGETAAIGGLTVTKSFTVKTGIPFLVDLPLVGRLFGQTRTEERKQDLLILVTPHILDEGEPAPIPAPRR
jgi:type IV pilus assembly protein PilQ